jgi:hypothetical protein
MRKKRTEVRGEKSTKQTSCITKKMKLERKKTGSKRFADYSLGAQIQFRASKSGTVIAKTSASVAYEPDGGNDWRVE